MTLTMTPTTRLSSSTRTTSFDVRSTGANEADPETYTGLSGAMSFTHVQKPATWPKAALQVAGGSNALTPDSDRHLALSV